MHEIYHDDLTAAVCPFLPRVHWVLEWLMEKNTWDKPETVIPETSKLSAKEFEEKAKGGWEVKKHSWSFFIFDGTIA